MNSSLFSHKELGEIVERLLLLDAELDQLLSEYQTNARRSEIETLKASCDPSCLLFGLAACLRDDSGEIETAQDFRSIPLEKEFFKCETIDWQIDSWSGVVNPNTYADKPHPWLDDPQMAKFPLELAECYESVLSSYFDLNGLSCNRREAWRFWSAKIFNAGTSPLQEDEEKWQEMQKAYFNSGPRRKEFLNNLLAAIRNPGGDVSGLTMQEGFEGVGENLFGFVYFVRNGDLCKIGITENLLRRLGELQPDEVLNVIRCKNFQDVERKMHFEFRDIRLPQTEYFRMDPTHIKEAHKLLALLAEL